MSLLQTNPWVSSMSMTSSSENPEFRRISCRDLNANIVIHWRRTGSSYG